MMASFVPIPAGSDFPLNNLPYGAFRPRAGAAGIKPRLCVALGEHVVDLAQLQTAGCFSGPVLSQTQVFCQVCSYSTGEINSGWLLSLPALQSPHLIGLI